MKTLYNAIEGFTETKSVFANSTVLVTIAFIAITLLSVAIKIALNSEDIQIGNW